MVIPKHRRGDRYGDPGVYTGEMRWDLDELAASLKITEEQVRTYFKDGRRSGFLVETRIVNENPALAPAPKNAVFDARDGEDMWEIRTITGNGVSFIPSVDRGGGRKFDPVRFEQKLHDVAGFIVCDVSKFPAVPYWSIPSRVIAKWHYNGVISSGAFSYGKAMKAIKDLYDD